MPVIVAYIKVKRFQIFEELRNISINSINVNNLPTESVQRNNTEIPNTTICNFDHIITKFLTDISVTIHERVPLTKS